MKNKYFDELQEMGFMEDQDFSEDPDFEPLPDSADDPGQVTRTFRRVLLGIGILTAAEELLIFFLIGGIFPSRSILKWSCMAGVLAGSLIGVLIFWLMKLQIARIAEVFL